MILTPHRSSAQCLRSHLAAFTLVEIMISSAIYLALVVSAVLFIQLFAMRSYALASTKLTATQSARKALNQIREDIKTAQMLAVGNCDNSGFASFTPVGGTTNAQGNALLVYDTTSTTNVDFAHDSSCAPYSLYYVQNITNLMVHLVQTNAAGNNSVSTTRLLNYITNYSGQYVFSALNYRGDILSNAILANQVYAVNLNFYQWEYPVVRVSTNSGDWNAYNYYHLGTRVCRRANN